MKKIAVTLTTINMPYVVSDLLKVIKYSFVLIYILIEYLLLYRILKKKNFWQYKNKEDFKYKII